MRPQPIDIALGDKSWRVRPLTLAQVQAMEPLVLDFGEARGRSVAGALAVLRIALARDHADAGATLDDIEATPSEAAAAVGQVLRLGGFLPAGDAAPGEAVAGPASTGPASTPRLMAGCHYTPAQIDALEIHDVAALLALWREQPPTHEILAAVYRVTPAPLPAAQDPSGIGALIARAPDGRVSNR